MRIGIDYTSAVRQHGGIGRYTRNLVDALIRMGDRNRYLLFVADRSDVASRQLWPEHVRLRRVPLSDRWTTFIWQRARIPLPIQLVTGRLDLFHSPDFALPPLGRVPALLTVHDLSFLRMPECFVPGFTRYLESAVSRAVVKATHILADSQSTRADLVEFLRVDEARITVLYPGIEERFQPVRDQERLERVRRAYGLPRQFVFSIGTLQPRKNFASLITAFGQVLKETPKLTRDLHLVIAGGKGWMYEEILSAAAEAEVADRVHLLGFVADEDLPELYSLASFFAFPSLYEGFGLPVLEAMACGVPVVTGDNSSLPEVAGEAALLVDASNQGAIAAGLLQLVSDPALCAEMAAAGQEQAKRFTWAGAARLLAQAYDVAAQMR
ncbi:MAG TPA: glycosyltransferase family 1 protein [Anaerolineae bacterium]|nr:glycosyltransferase family 1 protein [Anaerolineae bacterium]